MTEPETTGAVLDASAVLALLYAEPGSQAVAEYLEGGVISSINMAEVLQKIRQRSTTAAESRDAPAVFAGLGLRVQSTFTETNAIRSAEIWAAARHLALSLADRCCLAIADTLPGGFAVTADTTWTKLPEELGIHVRCVR